MPQFNHYSNMQIQSIDNIQVMFSTQQCDMPPIWMPTEAPNYTSLEVFQDKLNMNAMNVPSWDSPLDHLYLTIKATEFTTANSGIPATITTDP